MNGIQNTANLGSILVASLIALALIAGLVIVQKSWRTFLRWKTEQYHLQIRSEDICEDACQGNDGIAP